MGTIWSQYLSSPDVSASMEPEDSPKAGASIGGIKQASIIEVVASTDDHGAVSPNSNGTTSAASNLGDRTLSIPQGSVQESHNVQAESTKIPSEASQPSAAFKSLVERSIAAWQTINYVGQERGTEEQIAVINENALRLRSFHSLDEVLGRKGYWFFQLRDSFLRQKVFLKWDPTRLDEYVLLPVSYGFVNNRDCFFVSHYWLTKEHPDPKSVDLVQIQDDLRTAEWAYIWVDWTCVPQVPRTELQQAYFNRTLRYIHMLVRDCAFEWRFPAFEPRGWILFEVAEYVFNHKSFTWTDDNRPFVNHCLQMLTVGVRPVIEKYGYRCARQGDLALLIGSLELAVILVRILPDDVGGRQEIRDRVDEPYVGTVSDVAAGLEIDKVKGVISYQGKTYKFTPVYHLTADM